MKKDDSFKSEYNEDESTSRNSKLGSITDTCNSLSRSGNKIRVLSASPRFGEPRRRPSSWDDSDDEPSLPPVRESNAKKSRIYSADSKKYSPGSLTVELDELKRQYFSSCREHEKLHSESKRIDPIVDRRQSLARVRRRSKSSSSSQVSETNSENPPLDAMKEAKDEDVEDDEMTPGADLNLESKEFLATFFSELRGRRIDAINSHERASEDEEDPADDLNEMSSPSDVPCGDTDESYWRTSRKLSQILEIEEVKDKCVEDCEKKSSAGGRGKTLEEDPESNSGCAIAEVGTDDGTEDCDLCESSPLPTARDKLSSVNTEISYELFTIPEFSEKPPNGSTSGRSNRRFKFESENDFASSAPEMTKSSIGMTVDTEEEEEEKSQQLQKFIEDYPIAQAWIETLIGGTDGQNVPDGLKLNLRPQEEESPTRSELISSRSDDSRSMESKSTASERYKSHKSSRGLNAEDGKTSQGNDDQKPKEQKSRQPSSASSSASISSALESEASPAGKTRRSEKVDHSNNSSVRSQKIKSGYSVTNDNVNGARQKALSENLQNCGITEPSGKPPTVLIDKKMLDGNSVEDESARDEISSQGSDESLQSARTDLKPSKMEAGKNGSLSFRSSISPKNTGKSHFGFPNSINRPKLSENSDRPASAISSVAWPRKEEKSPTKEDDQSTSRSYNSRKDEDIPSSRYLKNSRENSAVVRNVSKRDVSQENSPTGDKPPNSGNSSSESLKSTERKSNRSSKGPSSGKSHARAGIEGDNGLPRPVKPPERDKTMSKTDRSNETLAVPKETTENSPKCSVESTRSSKSSCITGNGEFDRKSSAREQVKSSRTRASSSKSLKKKLSTLVEDCGKGGTPESSQPHRYSSEEVIDQKLESGGRPRKSKQSEEKNATNRSLGSVVSEDAEGWQYEKADLEAELWNDLIEAFDGGSGKSSATLPSNRLRTSGRFSNRSTNPLPSSRGQEKVTDDDEDDNDEEIESDCCDSFTASRRIIETENKARKLLKKGEVTGSAAVQEYDRGRRPCQSSQKQMSHKEISETDKLPKETFYLDLVNTKDNLWIGEFGDVTCYNVDKHDVSLTEKPKDHGDGGLNLNPFPVNLFAEESKRDTKPPRQLWTEVNGKFPMDLEKRENFQKYLFCPYVEKSSSRNSMEEDEKLHEESTGHLKMLRENDSDRSRTSPRRQVPSTGRSTKTKKSTIRETSSSESINSSATEDGLEDVKTCTRESDRTRDSAPRKVDQPNLKEDCLEVGSCHGKTKQEKESTNISILLTRKMEETKSNAGWLIVKNSREKDGGKKCRKYDRVNFPLEFFRTTDTALFSHDRTSSVTLLKLRKSDCFQNFYKRLISIFCVTSGSSSATSK